MIHKCYSFSDSKLFLKYVLRFFTCVDSLIFNMSLSKLGVIHY